LKRKSIELLLSPADLLRYFMDLILIGSKVKIW